MPNITSNAFYLLPYCSYSCCYLQTPKNADKLLFLVLFSYILFKVIRGQIHPLFQQTETTLQQPVLKIFHFYKKTLGSWMSRNMCKFSVNIWTLDQGMNCQYWRTSRHFRFFVVSIYWSLQTAYCIGKEGV